MNLIKKLQSTLIINSIGLFILFMTLFSYQGVRSTNPSLNHHSVVIDESILKEQLANYNTQQLQEMLHAGKEIQKWNGMLEKTGTHIVDKALKGFGAEHSPSGNAFDTGTHSQYYYHSHRLGEHGHFHLFLREEGMEKGVLPILHNQHDQGASSTNPFAHLIAISMDNEGYPLSLFTTNRWVTDENWYSSADLKKMIGKFEINHAYPSYVVNRWLKAMLILFEPQIYALIEARDIRIAEYSCGIPLEAVLEEHDLEVVTEEKISVSTQIKDIEKILSERSN